MNKTQNSFEIASHYTNFGWSVLPIFGTEDKRCACGNSSCPNPGKHAATTTGVYAATMDSIHLKIYFASSQNHNIGIATGEISNLLVLDINKQEGGFESLAAAIEDTGALETSLIVKTGGGGEHHYFWLPDGDFRTDTRGKLIGPGVNVLVDGAYAIAPGSRHTSGEKYKWKAGEPSETRMPGHLSKSWIKRLQGSPTIAMATMDGDVGDVLGWTGAIGMPQFHNVYLTCRGKLHFAFNYGNATVTVPASANATFLLGMRKLGPKEAAVWVEDAS